MSERMSGNHRTYSPIFCCCNDKLSRDFGVCLRGTYYTCELSLTETLLFGNTLQSRINSSLASASQNIAEDKISIKCLNNEC